MCVTLGSATSADTSGCTPACCRRRECSDVRPARAVRSPAASSPTPAVRGGPVSIALLLSFAVGRILETTELAHLRGPEPTASMCSSASRPTAAHRAHVRRLPMALRAALSPGRGAARRRGGRPAAGRDAMPRKRLDTERRRRDGAAPAGAYPFPSATPPPAKGRGPCRSSQEKKWSVSRIKKKCVTWTLLTA